MAGRRKMKVERKKEEKESEENRRGKSGFSTDNGAAVRQGFRAL